MIRPALAVFGILAMAACDPAGIATPVGMLDGDLVITPPAGYCIDPLSSRPRAGFAVFAPCMTLGTEAAWPAILGVATVQAGDAGSAMVTGDEAALRDFLTSPQGAGLLANGGSQTAISVVSSQSDGGRVTVHFRDTAAPLIDGLGQDEWRAFTDVGDRLVTVSVRALDDAPITAGRGAALLDIVVKGVQASGPAS